MDEHGYTGSYSIVQRYMKKCRSIQTEKANLELIWDPEPAQVDFGEADFYEAGKLCRKKYLTVSFPYSNDGYSQVFGGETADILTEGGQVVTTRWRAYGDNRTDINDYSTTLAVLMKNSGA